MASLKQVCEAMVTRLDPVMVPAGWNSWWFEKAPITAPFWCPTPEKSMSGDLERNLGTQARWMLRVDLFLDAEGDQDAAWDELGELIATDGLIVATMTDEDIRDDLYDVCGGDFTLNVAPTNTRGPLPVRKPRGRYLNGSIGFVLGSN